MNFPKVALISIISIGVGSCSSSIENNNLGNNITYCDPEELRFSEIGNCVQLEWRCDEDTQVGFVITRESRYENRLTGKATFSTADTKFLDCSILRGLRYSYSVSSTGNVSLTERIDVETKPIADFPIITDTKFYTGKLFEVTLDYTPIAPNPYDMTDLDVTMEVLKPSGSRDEAKGFFMTEYEIKMDNDGNESFIKGGDKIKVRYLPNEYGTYIVKFTVKDMNKTYTSGYYAFSVESFRNRDYISTSNRNPLFFSNEVGEYYFPIGFNIGWARNNGLFEFIKYMDKMSKENINLFRMWMIKWSNAIEWTKGKGSGDYNGLMKYAQDNAARIDNILRYAEQKNIKIMLTLGSYLEFTEGGHWDEGSWKENPYNVVNGGMCNNPEEFFTNEEAKKIYKNRLKYISARWGYSDSIFAYEFFNETYAPFEWVSEMSSFLRNVDYSRHLISTTYGDDKIYGLKNIDFTMAHLYGNPPNLIKDYPKKINELVNQYIQKYKKPFLLAEFGIDWSKSDYEYDNDGGAINLHNGIFASLSSGSSGTAMLWWWDDYIDRLDLYSRFSPVSDIVQQFGNLDDVKPLEANSLSFDAEKVNLFGISSKEKLLLWLQNKESNWYNEYHKNDYESVSGTITVNKLQIDCNAEVKIIDPWNSKVLDSFTLRVKISFMYTYNSLKRDLILMIKCI